MVGIVNERRSWARQEPSRPVDVVHASQANLTGVTWNLDDVPFSDIAMVGVEKARHRFRSALPDLIWNAAALEGNTFTLPEVRTLLEGVTVHGRPLEDERQVLALSEGYSFVDEAVGNGTFRLDKQTSDAVHALVARHEAIESGHFRGEGSVGGGGAVRLADGGYVEGVPPEQLPERWELLAEHLSGIDDARVRALAYNAAATRTQFYFDGNKRTARLMMAGELMSHGYDAVNIPNARRLEFNLALDALFSTNDATELMAFIASCAAS